MRSSWDMDSSHLRQRSSDSLHLRASILASSAAPEIMPPGQRNSAVRVVYGRRAWLTGVGVAGTWGILMKLLMISGRRAARGLLFVVGLAVAARSCATTPVHYSALLFT